MVKVTASQGARRAAWREASRMVETKMRDEQLAWPWHGTAKRGRKRAGYMQVQDEPLDP